MRWKFNKPVLPKDNQKIIRILKIVIAVSPAIFIVLFEVFQTSIFADQGPAVENNIFFITVAVFAVFLYWSISLLVKKTQEENLRRNRELTVLNDVARAVNASLDLNVLLPLAMEKVVQATGADSGDLFLINERSRELLYRLGVGANTPRSRKEADSLMKKGGLVREVARSIEPIIIQDTWESDRTGFFDDPMAEFRSLAVIPLKSRSGIVGVFAIYSINAYHFEMNQVEFLNNIGIQIAAAIENAHLYEKVQGLVIVEERERIAKELHDGLAQILGYVITKSEATRQILSKVAIASDYLVELENVAHDIYTDTREDILGLRTAISGDRDLVSALREYLARFSQMHGIKTELEVGEQSIPHLSPQVELQAIRIVQEALSNVRKHAEPNRALVKLSRSDNEVLLTVEDDGKGFNIDEIENAGYSKFGIRTIKERAESIHSNLDIDSKPGHGTKITLSIPLNLP